MRPQPILVTGLPRSGTTWLAREITRVPGTALAGREPMNPRATQYALGGTLHAWTRLDASTLSERQRAVLHRVYEGHEPRVFSRYGTRQWAAPWPRTRLVVKDPFALLSLPAVTELTGAVPIVLFRHPGALLASYRRMGWRPAVGEMERCLDAEADPALPPADHSGVEAMAWFWSVVYGRVLEDLAHVPTAVVVDHAELTRGGDPALRQVLGACRIAAGTLRDHKRSRWTRASTTEGARGPVLHDFDRSPTEITESWRHKLPADDVGAIEELTRPTWEPLRARRLRLEAEVSTEGTTPDRGEHA